MKKTWKPIAAGILMFLSSVPYVAAATRFYVTPGFLPENLGGGFVWAPLGVIVQFPFAFPLLAGGIGSIIRRTWGLVFAGAVTPLVLTVLLSPWGWAGMATDYLVHSLPTFPRYLSIAAVYLFMITAALLLYLSRREFKGRRSSTEHLFAPPEKIRNQAGR
jgi:hypothetical protein